VFFALFGERLLSVTCCRGGSCSDETIVIRTGIGGGLMKVAHLITRQPEHAEMVELLRRAITAKEALLLAAERQSPQPAQHPKPRRGRA
jgi:hypothetical protein